MRKLLQFAVLLFVSLSSFAATISGTVKDAEGRPLAGATVAVAAIRSIETDATGAFALDVPPGTYALRVTLAGFRSGETRAAAGDANVIVTLTPALAESIVVSGIRAEAATPVTKTTLDRDTIAARYHGQDVPLMLRDTPSINAYAESGVGGSGYSYFSLRGLAPSRINVTLDGVPLADSEDMATYFADFPDLARSLESVQIQRGAGTSTVGSASFAGSVNLESVALTAEQRIDATIGAASFGGRQATVGYQSGFLPGGFAVYSRLSFNESDGYRDNSGIEQRNLFVSAAKLGERSQLKLTGFTAREEQQLSFYATDADTLRTSPRANPLTPDEIDSFGYDLAQLQYIRDLGDGADMTASAYYQRGYGWYRLYDYAGDEPVLREYGLDGMLIGTTLNYSRTRGALTTQLGAHVNRFERDHTRDALLNGERSGSRDYANYGVKSEANVFAKVSWDRDRLHLYGDGQLRHTSFEYHGDVAVDPIDWTFFNPRAGVRYDVSSRSGVYGSAGISTREPARVDLFLGEDNASVSHDLHAVKPERVLDLELGWDHRRANVTLAANLYAMEFRNEIAATGELSEVGLPLRRNVDRSYRRGLELDASWQALPSLRLRTSANVSVNRIGEWTQFYDVYDDVGNWIDSKPVVHRDVEPLLTPAAIVSQSFDYTPSSRLLLGTTLRYVAKSYLDNTNDERFVSPSFATADVNAMYALGGGLRVIAQINNLFDNDRVHPSGYSYLYFTRDRGGDVAGGTAYFYPQAGRHAVVMLQYKP